MLKARSDISDITNREPTISELKETLEGGDVLSAESIGELKQEINNFVWMYARGTTTLSEADGVAMTILYLLRPELAPTDH